SWRWAGRRRRRARSRNTTASKQTAGCLGRRRSEPAAWGQRGDSRWRLFGPFQVDSACGGPIIHSANRNTRGTRTAHDSHLLDPAEEVALYPDIPVRIGPNPRRFGFFLSRGGRSRVPGETASGV